MNRYKITGEQLQITKKFLAGKISNKVPNFAKKYKDDLTVKKGKVFYKNQEIIPIENVEAYLRKTLYTKGENVPLSRDGCFHAMKSRQVIGISRRAIMNFIKAQPAIEMGKNALPARKKAGKKLKNVTIETDLIFIRRPDLEKINKKFKKSSIPRESYIVCTVEKLTGLTRTNYVKTKLPSVVGPIVKKHVLSICKQLGVDSKTVDLHSDAGGEFRPAYLSQFVKKYEVVKVGSSIEKKNQDVQRTFYQLFRARRAGNIVDALRQTEAIVNNNVNRIQKKTPNESASSVNEEKKEDEIRSNYNAKRQKADTSDKRNIEVGDYVRLLIKKPKGDGFYKSYKGLTWSGEVYQVKKKTKKAAIPKYRVGQKWYTANSLLVSRKEDQVSKDLVQARDEADEKEEDDKQLKHIRKRELEFKKKQKREALLKSKEEKERKRAAEYGVPEPPRRRSSRRAAKEARIKQLKAMQEERRLDKLLGV